MYSKEVPLITRFQRNQNGSEKTFIRLGIHGFVIAMVSCLSYFSLFGGERVRGETIFLDVVVTCGTQPSSSWKGKEESLWNAPKEKYEEIKE